MKLIHQLTELTLPVANTDEFLIHRGTLDRRLSFQNLKAAISSGLTVTASQISDSGATGRSVLASANQAAARTALGFGATGSAVASAANSSAGQDAIGMTAVGKSLAVAADQAAARTAIDAAESVHTHMIVDITNSGAMGRTIMAAVTDADVRTAIGSPAVSHTHTLASLTTTGIDKQILFATTTGVTSNAAYVFDSATGQLSTTFAKLTGTTEPAALSDGQVWIQSDELKARLGGTTKTFLNDFSNRGRTLAANGAIASTDRNKAIITTAGITLTLNLVTGAKIGDTITIINTSGSNTTLSDGGANVSFTGGPTIAATSLARIHCVKEDPSDQIWFFEG